MIVASPLAAQPTVPTHRYDGARVGANLSETALTVATVNVNTFGKLYSYPVDGSVYAQPLYVPGVTIGGLIRNVLYVATMNDKIYAFDADSPSATPLWVRDVGAPSGTPVPIDDITSPNLNIIGNVGIHGTPVIDPVSGTIYFVGRTKENNTYLQRLHALDIATGAPKPGSPVTITGSVTGSAPDAVAGVLSFNPKMSSQRAALALTNGVVLIAWGGHEDILPWHGWIMGYDANTLAKVGTFCVTPDGYGGGVWQGGRAPTLDGAGNAYFATGNGTWDGTRNFGQSLLKFSVGTSGISLIDSFTPGNYDDLNRDDDDLSGSGFTLLPETRLMLGGGKEGTLYLLDADKLGRMVPGDPQIPQRIVARGGHVMGGAVHWKSSKLGRIIYNWSEDDYLRAYKFDGSKLESPDYAQGLVLSPGHPGGSLTLSANGSAPGTGIIWASLGTNQDGIHGLVAGVLRAFDAETLTELWNSEQNPGRDRVGMLMKFVPPLVVNGRVYMPSHDNSIAVYGANPPSPPTNPATIGIDFVGSNSVAMGASEVAGVYPAQNWNAAFGIASSVPLPLRTASGALSPATATWAVPSGAWALPIADQPGDARMMRGYLDTRDTSHAIVTVAGLPLGTYDVYVYVDGDNPNTDRSGAYTISGPGITTTTANLLDPIGVSFAGTYKPADGGAGNYVRFTIAGTGFTVDATPVGPGTSRRAPVNGIQIVPASEPPPDFSIAAAPGSRVVSQGSSATYTVSIGAVNGFTGTVSLSASATAPGITATFAPSSIAGAGTSTMTVTTTSGTPIGATTLTIAATSGTLRHTTPARLAVEAAPPHDGVISIDFVGTSPVAMDATEVAGVVRAQNWNAAFGIASSAPLPLRTASGAPSSATATWSVPRGTWSLPIADQPGDARMMRGYLDTRDTSHAIINVTGLPYATYDVYVYVDGDNPNTDRSGAYTISGPGITTTTVNLVDPINVNFAGTYTRADGGAGNYIRFTITAAGLTLDATALASATSLRAPVNGIQIVPTPPPPPIGIDFTGNAVSVMAADESAGVVPQVHWNSANGAAQAAPLPLVDASGAATAASVTWTANNGWSLPIGDEPGNKRMMLGYLDTSSTSVTTVTVNGLRAGSHDVYVYVDGANPYTRTATYRLTTTGSAATVAGVTDAANTNFAGTFVEAGPGGEGNYLKFTINGDGFTLSAVPGAAPNGGSLRAPVNAIQIVPR